MASIQNNSFNLWHFSEEKARQGTENKIHGLFEKNEVSGNVKISEGGLLSIAILIATVVADIFTAPFRGAWHLGERFVQWITAEKAEYESISPDENSPPVAPPRDQQVGEKIGETDIPLSTLVAPLFKDFFTRPDSTKNSPLTPPNSPSLTVNRKREVDALIVRSDVSESEEDSKTDGTPSDPQPIPLPSDGDRTPSSTSDDDDGMTELPSDFETIFDSESNEASLDSNSSEEVETSSDPEVYEPGSGLPTDPESSASSSSESEIPLLVPGPISDTESSVESEADELEQFHVVIPSAPYDHTPVVSGDETGVRAPRGGDDTAELESVDLEALFQEDSSSASDSSPVQLLNSKAARPIEDIFLD